MRDILLSSLAAVLLLGLASLAAGALFGAAWGWAFLSAALAVLLGYHVWHLGLLRRWLQDPGGRPVPEGAGIWREVLTQIHRRRRAQMRERRRLARLLARSRRAGRALPYGVAILDGEHRIVWCNDASEAHFGIDAVADRGQPITHLVRQPEFVAYVAGGDYSRPLRLRSRRAGERMLSVQLVPYIEARYLLLSSDITEAERIEVMRRDFVANVSHELRTPLTVLVGFLETVRDLKLEGERAREYLRLMAEQAERMQRIVSDLLTLSALESAPMPALERVPIAPLLERVRVEAEALSAGRHRILLEAQGDFDLLGSADEIASAFGNLASNAVRYTPAGGEVRLCWRASPEGAEFAVEDTGIGIEAEHIPRLTERFYRVDRGRSRETGGTGLGLAIVKHVLLRHQAALDIRSTPGKGSRFAVRFPRERLAPALAPRANQPAPAESD